mgnify:FL=1
MSTSLTAAQALLTLIDANRRTGSTTLLLECPKVVSGEALFVAWNQDALDQAIQDCPTLRGTTLQRLKEGVGDTRGPMVFDLTTVYAALMETAEGPRDPELHPYDIVGFGESRDITEIRGDDGKIERLEPKPGSEKAWVKLRLRDGNTHRVEVPYTVPVSA